MLNPYVPYFESVETRPFAGLDQGQTLLPDCGVQGIQGMTGDW